MKLPKLQDINNFLVRLSKREKLFFYAAFSFILLAMLDRLIIHPIYSRIQYLSKEIAEKELGIKNMLYILAQKDRISSERIKYGPYLKKAEFQEEEITSLLKEIEALANKSSVYLIDIKPQGFKNIGTFRRYLITLNCEAQLEQLIEFMYSIENSNYLLSVRKYQISPKTSESSVATCNMSIYKMIM